MWYLIIFIGGVVFGGIIGFLCCGLVRVATGREAEGFAGFPLGSESAYFLRQYLN